MRWAIFSGRWENCLPPRRVANVIVACSQLDMARKDRDSALPKVQRAAVSILWAPRKRVVGVGGGEFRDLVSGDWLNQTVHLFTPGTPANAKSGNRSDSWRRLLQQPNFHLLVHSAFNVYNTCFYIYAAMKNESALNDLGAH